MKVRPITLVNFERYNPPPKSLSKDQRGGGPLKWVRLQCDWYDDQDLLDSDDAMRLWPRLLALAGTTHGVVEMSAAQLAREVRLDVDVTERGISHLKQRKMVTISHRKGGPGHLEGGANHQEGGSDHPNG